MTKRAHIRNGEIIRRYNSESGQAVLEDGGKVAPIPLNAAYGNDRFVPIVEEVVDNSTTEHTATTRQEIVEEDRVLVTVTIEDAPVPVPDRVSSRQFKMQLHASGLTSQVETWVSQQDPLVQIAYANSGTFVRDEPMMAQGFADLGFTEQQIDDFFTAAAAL